MLLDGREARALLHSAALSLFMKDNSMHGDGVVIVPTPRSTPALGALHLRSTTPQSTPAMISRLGFDEKRERSRRESNGERKRERE